MRRQFYTTAASAALAATLVTLAIGTARAADDCVTAPNGDTPPGRHWYYRTDKATKRKCWYLGQHGRAGAAPDSDARNAAETVGHGQPAAPAGPAPAASGDAATSRDCAIAQSVLNYRKILATVFHSDAAGTDVDAQARELAAKGCANADR